MKINNKNLIILLLFFSVIILGFIASDKQREIDNYINLELQQKSLLFGDGKAAGYTCGVLNQNKAKSILSAESIRSEYGQGPTDTVGANNTKLDKIFWTDSCRYEDSTNNSKYVEFYVATFQNNFEAAENFSKFLPLVGNPKEINMETTDQKLVYDSGVLFLLSGNQIIQVAASNGSSSEQEQFTKNTFNTLLEQI